VVAPDLPLAPARKPEQAGSRPSTAPSAPRQAYFVSKLSHLVVHNFVAITREVALEVFCRTCFSCDVGKGSSPPITRLTGQTFSPFRTHSRVFSALILTGRWIPRCTGTRPLIIFADVEDSSFCSLGTAPEPSFRTKHVRRWTDENGPPHDQAAFRHRDQIGRSTLVGNLMLFIGVPEDEA